MEGEPCPRTNWDGPPSKTLQEVVFRRLIRSMVMYGPFAYIWPTFGQFRGWMQASTPVPLSVWNNPDLSKTLCRCLNPQIIIYLVRYAFSKSQTSQTSSQKVFGRFWRTMVAWENPQTWRVFDIWSSWNTAKQILYIVCTCWTWLVTFDSIQLNPIIYQEIKDSSVWDLFEGPLFTKSFGSNQNKTIEYWSHFPNHIMIFFWHRYKDGVGSWFFFVFFFGGWQWGNFCCSFCGAPETWDFGCCNFW